MFSSINTRGLPPDPTMIDVMVVSENNGNGVKEHRAEHTASRYEPCELCEEHLSVKNVMKYPQAEHTLIKCESCRKNRQIFKWD